MARLSTSVEKALPTLAAKIKKPLRLGVKGQGVAALQDYLLKYGFLTPQAAPVVSPVRERVAALEPVRLLNAYTTLVGYAFSSMQHALEVPRGEFDQRTSVALKKMQSFHGLKPTGALDEPTLNLLKQARYDHHPDIPLFAVAAQWDHTNLTYTFVNSGTKLADAQARDVIRRAFQTWESVSKLNFRKVDPGPADIKVMWARRDHGDGYPFDGPWGILAHGFFPPPRGERPGDLHIDDDEDWRDDPSSSPTRKEADLVTVAAHEIGHCLGLDHSRDKDALMYSYYGGPRRDTVHSDLARLNDDDIQGIKQLYP